MGHGAGAGACRGQKVPAGHCAGSAVPGPQLKPGGQGNWLALAEAAAHQKPAVQFRQAAGEVWLGRALKVPGGQGLCVALVAAAPLQWPGGVGRQEAAEGCAGRAL